jgi:hypothetical protein
MVQNELKNVKYGKPFFFFLNQPEGVDGPQGSVGPTASEFQQPSGHFQGPRGPEGVPVSGALTRHFWGPEKPPIISI